MYRSYGITAQDFNAISRAVNRQPMLKRKILLQAYYYKCGLNSFNALLMFFCHSYFAFSRILCTLRIAADLQSNLRPTLPMLPIIGRRAASVRVPYLDVAAAGAGGGDHSGGKQRQQSDSQLQRFSRAVADIERERLRMREHLKVQLQCLLKWCYYCFECKI